MTEQLTLALLFHLQLGGLCVVNPQRKTKKLYRTSLFFFPPGEVIIIVDSGLVLTFFSVLRFSHFCFLLSTNMFSYY